MAVKVRIPVPLQKITEGKPEVNCNGQTIEEILLDLESKYPEVRKRMYDEKGELKRFINIYLNEEDIRFLDGEKTKVKEEDEISIIPAIAGGGVDVRFK